jgi:thiol:disulfide interchange protein DsbC
MRVGNVSRAFVCVVCLCGASAAVGADSADVAKVREEISRKYPKLQISDVKATNIRGPLLEVTAGQNVIYYDQSEGHLIFGEVWTKDGINITSKKKEALVAESSKGNLTLFRANLDKAVKVGNGKHEVIELTDPDCPYCRKMADYWDKRSDVTRYVFLMPIPALHPKAEAKSNYILASADKASTLKDVFQGKYDSSLPKAAGDTGLLNDHKKLTAQSGLQGTPAYFIDGVFVHGANVPAIEKVIGTGK